jgi:hypothetical protein
VNSPLRGSTFRPENFRQIQERVTDRLLDLAQEYENIQPNFYLTSVYDHSIHEAFSRVLHKLIDSLPYLEDMLNVFCAVRLYLMTSELFHSYRIRTPNHRKLFSSTQSHGYTSPRMHPQWTLPPTICVATILRCLVPLELFISKDGDMLECGLMANLANQDRQPPARLAIFKPKTLHTYPLMVLHQHHPQRRQRMGFPKRRAARKRCFTPAQLHHYIPRHQGRH